MVNEKPLIAAKITSPGPAYALPTLIGERGRDPRSVHFKYPAYSFGIRHGKFKDSFGPGPAHYPNPKVYRDGCDGVPHYSLYSRLKTAAGFSNPGPGAYCPEYAGPVVHHHYPSYSFGSRHCYYKPDIIPAANNYSLPSMIGPTVQSGKPQAPCYSLRSRPKIEKYLRTPGPGTYNQTNPNMYKNQAPLFSMTSRNHMPGDTSQKPGPGSHMPCLGAVKRCSPAYSFGVRHSDYTTSLIVDIPSIDCSLCDAIC